MKKYLYIGTALAAAVLLFSCAKETVNPYEQVSVLSVKAIDSQFEYGPLATTGVIVLDTDASLTVTSDRPWCVPSVSGNKINLNISANAGKINRYALLTVKSPDASVDVSIIQYGEILAGLESLSDVTSQVEGEVITVPVKVNVDIDFDVPESWVHIVQAEDALVITVDKNTEPRTRFCTVNYTAGSQSGSFDITQYPELKQNDSWSLSLDDATYLYPKFNASTSVSAGSEDMYVLSLVPVKSVTGTVQDYIFSNLAVSARRDILAKVERQGGSFADYLDKGSETRMIEDVAVGDNYLIAIGFGDNGFVTGQYQYKAVTIEDVRSPYYKWTGKWLLEGKNIEGSDYSETIELSVLDTDVDDNGKLLERYLVVTGLCSKNAAAVSMPEGVGWDRMYVSYDSETGGLVFYGQSGTVTFEYGSYGAGCALQLISMYVKAGATAYTNVTGGRFLSAQMNGDGKTTTLTALERSAGLPYRAFRMRLLIASGSAYTIGGNAATIAIDENLTLTRVN